MAPFFFFFTCAYQSYHAFVNTEYILLELVGTQIVPSLESICKNYKIVTMDLDHPLLHS